jgi:hypothetical protein
MRFLSFCAFFAEFFALSAARDRFLLTYVSFSISTRPPDCFRVIRFLRVILLRVRRVRSVRIPSISCAVYRGSCVYRGSSVYRGSCVYRVSFWRDAFYVCDACDACDDHRSVPHWLPHCDSPPDEPPH